MAQELTTDSGGIIDKATIILLIIIKIDYFVNEGMTEQDAQKQALCWYDEYLTQDMKEAVIVKFQLYKKLKTPHKTYE
ncbi:hypothetical protein [Paraflavitalea speifideaquila]|uniref:hypothetical protein n=1 Tax=Paraflavitalea speifideaquila TaxID=3076558 RepID=UPI0028F0D748|nr:hypothetical protein [Paraflavitalea speifideiaquila]